MSHGIRENDRPIFVGKPAWHRLGKVMEAHLPADQLLAEAGMDTYEAEKVPVFSPEGEEVEGWKAIRRSDTKESWGMVQDSFIPLQAKEWLDTIVSLTEDDSELLFDSIGTYDNGRVMFASVQLSSFGVGLNNSDENYNYANFVNGHYGMAYHANASSFRIECQNLTLLNISMAKKAKALVTFRHTKNISSRVSQARDAILRVKQSSKEFAKQAKAMADKPLNTNLVAEYFCNLYKKVEGTFVDNPTNAQEQRKKNRQDKIIGEWIWNFQANPTQQTNGIQGTLWAAYNAVTSHTDHQRTIRVSEGKDREAHRSFNNIFGSAANVKRDALAMAVDML